MKPTIEEPDKSDVRWLEQTARHILEHNPSARAKMQKAVARFLRGLDLPPLDESASRETRTAELVPFGALALICGMEKLSAIGSKVEKPKAARDESC